MNCKPGDLAVAINSKYAGKLFEILRQAPAHRFQLPDGVLNKGEPEGLYWVVKVLGTPIWVAIKNHPDGGRFAMYGTANDARLRPIRGLPVDENIDEEITA